MPAAIPTTFKRWLRSARDAAREGTEALWRLAFRFAGRVRPGHVPLWSSPGGQRIVVVAPHPDDETIGCGGTLACHVAAGDEVIALFVTDGRRSRALGLAPGEMARRRGEEATRASAALGVRAEWWGLPEGEWREVELRKRLREFLANLDPHVLYAPSRVDFHPEHVRVAHTLGSVVEESLDPATCIRVYPIQVPLTSLLVNLMNDVSHVEALPRALAAYVTQAGTLNNGLRQRRESAALHRIGSLSDEFWEMTPAAYAALHRGEPDPMPWKSFRGIRNEPWTDPLAHLIGRAERRRLARLVRGAEARPNF